MSLSMDNRNHKDHKVLKESTTIWKKLCDLYAPCGENSMLNLTAGRNRS